MEHEIAVKFASYPESVRSQMYRLRDLILSVAEEANLGPVSESLKWGEPSFQVKGGSPVRIDWKPRFPEQYAVYFNCNTSLVETFRELYGDQLRFQGKRAIVLRLDEPFPEKMLAHCLAMALQYQSLRHLPLLGA